MWIEAAEFVGSVTKDLAKKIVETWIEVHAPWAADLAPVLFEMTWKFAEQGAADWLEDGFDPQKAVEAAFVAGAVEIADMLVDKLVTDGMEAKVGSLDELDGVAEFTMKNFKAQLQAFVGEFVEQCILGDKSAGDAAIAAIEKSQDSYALAKRMMGFGIDEKLGVSLQGFVKR